MSITAATADSAPPVDRALRLRVVSGIVLAGVAVAAIAAGGVMFTGLVVAAVVLMAWEWDRLCGGTGWGPVPSLHAGAAVLTVLLATNDAWAMATGAAAAGVAVTAGAAFATGRAPRWVMAGYLYSTVPAFAVVWLRFEAPLGAVAVLWAFAVIWATDTGAYFSGRAIGGPKLAPRISPGKTWAGAIGGAVAATAAALVVAWWADVGPVWALAVAGMTVSVVGQAGDLLISRIKRRFRVKDSGTLIPGHGGVLDRLDSTLSALPLLALALALVQRSGFPWP